MQKYTLRFTANKPFVNDVPSAWLEPTTAQIGATLNIGVTEFPNGPFQPPVVNVYRFCIVEVIYSFSGDHNGITQTEATPAELVLAYEETSQSRKKTSK